MAGEVRKSYILKQLTSKPEKDVGSHKRGQREHTKLGILSEKPIFGTIHLHQDDFKSSLESVSSVG